MAKGSEDSGVTGLLKEAGKQLIPVLLTAGSLIGFVAFAGGVIVWTRFSAAKVPPDQAVNAVPRDELVAIGSALLLLFGFFGVLALVGAFLTDRGARATPGMARGLLGLFLVEGVTSITIVGGLSVETTIADAALIALPVAATFWATFAAKYVDLVDDLPIRRSERAGDRDGDAKKFLLSPDGPDPALIASVGILGAALIVTVFRGDDLFLAIWLGAWLIGFIGYVAFRCTTEARTLSGEIANDRQREREQAREAYEWERARARFGFSGMDEEELPEFRQLNERPWRLELKAPGARLIAGLLVVAAVLPWLRTDEWWVGVSIATAGVLCAALWRIAALSAQRVIWYGVAVFISVPLFGTLTSMARNVANPQVQPMALIRNTDGPAEAIQGLYVTEADERVYFATVASEGCSDELTPRSGRLEWVPKSEVVAMTVGPLQSVEEAGRSALEMAYSLTPAVESSLGNGANFDEEEKMSIEEAEAAEFSSRDKRLEHTGPAVRPNFGGGLSLSPEDASPGDIVTLRMSKPNKHPDVEGFGRARIGRTLRVGGLRARIVKQSARTAEGAEYLKTDDGRLLRLAKGEPYKEDGEEFDSMAGDAEAVKGGDVDRVLLLNDPQVVAVGKRKMRAPGIPLALKSGSTPRLAEQNLTVTLRAKGEVGALGRTTEAQIDPHPLGQAWSEGQIRFEVPPGAASGAVSVECSQLAGEPLLRVLNAPEPRISVRMQRGSDDIRFSSRHTTDVDEEDLVRRWNVAGAKRGNLPGVTVTLPPHRGVSTVRLTVADEGGAVSTAEVHLLRLPSALFESGSARLRRSPMLRAAERSLARVVDREAPKAIEIEGHASDARTAPANAFLSLRRAQAVHDALLREPLIGANVTGEVPVRTVAFGQSCPVSRQPDDRHVDVLVLDEGVSMLQPRSCRPVHIQNEDWQLSPGCPVGRSASGSGLPSGLLGLVQEGLGEIGSVIGLELGDRSKCSQHPR